MPVIGSAVPPVRSDQSEIEVATALLSFGDIGVAAAGISCAAASSPCEGVGAANRATAPESNMKAGAMGDLCITPQNGNMLQSRPYPDATGWKHFAWSWSADVLIRYA